VNSARQKSPEHFGPLAPLALDAGDNPSFAQVWRRGPVPHFLSLAQRALALRMFFFLNLPQPRFDARAQHLVRWIQHFSFGLLKQQQRLDLRDIWRRRRPWDVDARKRQGFGQVLT